MNPESRIIIIDIDILSHPYGKMNHLNKIAAYPPFGGSLFTCNTIPHRGDARIISSKVLL